MTKTSDTDIYILSMQLYHYNLCLFRSMLWRTNHPLYPTHSADGPGDVVVEAEDVPASVSRAELQQTHV